MAQQEKITGGQVSTGLIRARFSLTPLCSTSPAYTIGDAIGGLVTVTNAARLVNGSGQIDSLTLLCLTPALIPVVDFYVFNQLFTPTADNSPFAPTDADMANCIGVIGIGNWAGETASSANSIASRFALGFPYICAGGNANIYGQMVTRTAITLISTADLTLNLTVAQD